VPQQLAASKAELANRLGVSGLALIVLLETDG